MGDMHKHWQLKTIFWPNTRIIFVTAHNLFLNSNFSKYFFLSIRGYSWHKKLNKKRYSRNNFQDSTKEKYSRNKTLGYLPRVLFFNVFQLAAERDCIKYFQVK